MNGVEQETGRYADVNGLHMYYEIHGSGRPMVLIQGKPIRRFHTGQLVPRAL